MGEKNYKVCDEIFIETVKCSKNICQVLKKLGLSFKGASYGVFKKRCEMLKLSIAHFEPDKIIRNSLSIESINEVIKSSQSRMDCLKRLELNPNSNANLNWIESIIISHKIDNSHWCGLGHLKGKTHNWGTPTPLADLLVEKSYTSSSNLKKRLIKCGLLEEKCSRCEIIEWQGEKLSLQLEHKNGESIDNRIENLTLLCPNCHSLTSTYCRKKSSLKQKPVKLSYSAKTVRKLNNCMNCSKLISKGALRCKPCTGRLLPTKISWPSYDELKSMIESSSYLAVSKLLGVSDNAIRKRIKRCPG